MSGSPSAGSTLPWSRLGIGIEAAFRRVAYTPGDLDISVTATVNARLLGPTQPRVGGLCGTHALIDMPARLGATICLIVKVRLVA